MAEMFKAAKTSSRIDHAKYGDWKARFFAASGDIKLEVILNRLVMAIFPEQFCSVIKPERLLRICNALQEWTGIRLSEKPEDYGLHFWWGDTVGYRREGNAWVASDGSSRNFEFCGDNEPTWGKDIGTLQSEGWITSAGILAPEHDAAHVHWGGNWRMPTKDELAALNSNCDWTSLDDAGSDGHYWSSVPHSDDYYHSWRLYFPSRNLGTYLSRRDRG